MDPTAVPLTTADRDSDHKRAQDQSITGAGLQALDVPRCRSLPRTRRLLVATGSTLGTGMRANASRKVVLLAASCKDYRPRCRSAADFVMATSRFHDSFQSSTNIPVMTNISVTILQHAGWREEQHADMGITWARPGLVRQGASSTGFEWLADEFRSLVCNRADMRCSGRSPATACSLLTKLQLVVFCCCRQELSVRTIQFRRRSADRE